MSDPSNSTITITPEFVGHWSSKYDRQASPRDIELERDVRDFLKKLPDPKYLDRENFLKLCNWKSARAKRHYERNKSETVERITKYAYEHSDAEMKLRIVEALHGVGVPVGSTILHFLHPNQFAIFDVRAKQSLARAGKWSRGIADASPGAWLEYVSIMTDLARPMNVSLRDLDKALWACDRGHGLP